MKKTNKRLFFQNLRPCILEKLKLSIGSDFLTIDALGQVLRGNYLIIQATFFNQCIFLPSHFNFLRRKENQQYSHSERKYKPRTERHKRNYRKGPDGFKPFKETIPNGRYVAQFRKNGANSTGKPTTVGFLLSCHKNVVRRPRTPSRGDVINLLILKTKIFLKPFNR